MKVGLESVIAPELTEYLDEVREFNAAAEARGGYWPNPDVRTPEGLREAREGMSERPAGPGPAPVELVAEAEERQVRVRVLEPWSGAPRGVFLEIHGGGFYMGWAARSDARNRRFAEALGIAVVSVDYRLAPEHPFPAALDDLRSTYAWLRGRLDASQIVVMGDSAGGGLALSLVMSLRDRASALPAGLVMMSPWVDLAMRGESYVDRADRDPIETAEVLEWSARAYAGGTSLTDPRISPRYGNFAGLPPMMVLVGSEEMMYDDSIGIERRARALGVDVTLDIEPGMPHVYPRFAARLTAGQRAVERMGDFVKSRFHQDT